MTKLEDFLNDKPLFYKEIDYDRMPRTWQKIKEHFKLPKIIHIVGTNGKGSTGRFLAWHLYKEGLKVGHYSSPHLLRFNERIWLNGFDVSDEKLELAHQKLQKILDKKSSDALSYFEYTTLIAIAIYEDCEYVVLEAGLGGEYDATSVFDNILTLCSTIDIDHESFLGDNITDIATTKLNAVKRALIVGYQNSDEVLKVAKEICTKKDALLIEYDEFVGVSEFIKSKNLPSVFAKNLNLAFLALKFLGFIPKLDLLSDIILFARAQKIAPNITIDVGHNALAARALLDHFKDKKINLIFNTFSDKDYEKTLTILKPIIKKLSIIEVDNERIQDQKELILVLDKLKIDYEMFKSCKDDEEYLVFGSFSVVEKFLNEYHNK
jgi:dihydrofolate synthase/folylpolyglutamate synthase